MTARSIHRNKGGAASVEGPGAQEEQPADPAPRRRALRRAGRAGQPQGLLPAGPAAEQPAVKPRGVLLLGVPGTGKACFAKALGNETGRPTLLLDLGALMGSLVGQTEANIRQALQIADAMSPAILFVDELEKALTGVGSQGDSGVSTRLFGTLLTWLVGPRRPTSSSSAPPTTSASCRRSSPGRSASTASSSSTCRPGRRRTPSGDMYRRPVRHPGRQAAAGRRRLDRGRDQSLLPAGGPAGRAVDPGGPPRRAGGGHGGRAGGAAADLGQRPLPVGLRAGHLQPEARPAKPGRRVYSGPSNN